MLRIAFSCVLNIIIITSFFVLATMISKLLVVWTQTGIGAANTFNLCSHLSFGICVHLGLDVLGFKIFR